MKTTLLLLFLSLSSIGMGQELKDIPDSTKNKIILEYLTSIQTQVTNAKSQIVITDGISITKNLNWSELLMLMIEDVKRKKLKQ